MTFHKLVGPRAEVRRNSTGTQHSPTKLIPKVVVSILAFIVALIIAESTLRAVGIGYGHSPIIGHPAFHHWHPSDYSFLQWDPNREFGGFQNHFNSEGFAMGEELPDPQEPTIIFVGDSFVEGLQVPEDERLSTLVEKQLGIRCLNFGCSSFSPLLTRLQLKYFQERVTPIAVVLILFDNDISSDSKFAALATKDTRGECVAVPGSNTPWWISLARQSYLARLVRKSVLAYKHDARMRERVFQRSRLNDKRFHDRPLDELYTNEELKLVEDNILAIAQWSRKRNSELFLTSVPDRVAVKRDGDAYFSNYFQQFATREGIRWIDLLGAFRHAGERKLFFQHDIHFTNSGHAVAADAIVESIGRWLASDANTRSEHISR